MCTIIVLFWTMLLLTTAAEKDFNQPGRPKRIENIKNRINMLGNFLSFEYMNFSNFASPTFGLLHRGCASDNFTSPESTNRSRNYNTSDSSLPQRLTDVNSSSSDIGESNRPRATRYYLNDYYRDCGKLQLTRFKRIAGGHDSSLGRIPWQVALFEQSDKDRPFCGGALLSNKWIITAGHCVIEKPMKSLIVRLGVNDIEKKEGEILHKDYKVNRRKIHHKYTKATHSNDIALLQLDRTVRFDWHIIPICLPSRDLEPNGRIATVSGWGRRVDNDYKSSPAILNEVDIKVIPNHVCQRWFLETGRERKIDEIFLCAGQSSGGRDSCRGDSGGPLTTSEGGRKVLIGIVSWGFGCGKERLPGLYTNIKTFMPWITKVIS